MADPTPATPPSALPALRAGFAPEPARAEPLTVGIEEELMLLDARTLDLRAEAAAVLERARGDARFKSELPAAQLEIALPPAADAAGAAAALLAARRELAAHAAPEGRLAAAGVHPFAPGEGAVARSARYDELLAEYGSTVRRQLVFGLHVHVALPGAERALAVHNALRGDLPLLAALGANAPFYEGRDTGHASVRPRLCGLLPRQGVPPAFATLEAYAAALDWGLRAGRLAHPREWWWELRLHPRLGTVETRVCDAQLTAADAAALAALVRARVAALAERHDAGEPLPVPDTWRIAENRWLAARYGLDAELADPETGERAPARERARTLLAALGPVAERLGDGAALAHAARLADRNGAERQRAAAGGDARRAAAFAAEQFDFGQSG